MYDPCTVAHEIKYPWRAHSKKWCDARGMKADEFMRRYHASFITIWHRDPERPSKGQRTDDSCGWFDRRAREYEDAIAYLLNDKQFVHEVRLILSRKAETPAPFYEGISEEQLSWPRLPYADALALCLMVARQLELRRWWNGQGGNGGAHREWWRRTFTRQRDVDDVAVDLALSPGDNLCSVDDAAKALKLIAAALSRKFKPWWKHPRWHVHHWRLQIHPWQQFKRWAFERCAGCGKGYTWGYCPVSNGNDKTFHEKCYGPAMLRPNTATGQWEAS